LIDSQTILTIAPSEKDVFASRRRSCQIEFYLGVFELERGAQDKGRQLLKAVEIVLDVEQLTYESANLLNAESTLNRIARTGLAD
jgi:hypothetical protein